MLLSNNTFFLLKQKLNKLRPFEFAKKSCLISTSFIDALENFDYKNFSSPA